MLSFTFYKAVVQSLNLQIRRLRPRCYTGLDSVITFSGSTVSSSPSWRLLINAKVFNREKIGVGKAWMIQTDKHNRPTYTAPPRDILNSPPPSAHHQRVGVDKSLRQQSALPPSLSVLHPSRKAKLRARAARQEQM